MWSRFIGGGGALLALCFFFPAIHACDSDTVPAAEMADLLAQPEPRLIQTLAAIGMFAVPYLFGLALLLGVLARTSAWQRAVDVIVVLLVSFAALLVTAILADDLTAAGPRLTLLFALPAATTAIYLTRALRRGAPGRWCLRWYGSVLCTIWFATWCSMPDTRYGLWLSLGASLSLVTAFIGAVASALGVPVSDATRALILCRLDRVPD